MIDDGTQVLARPRDLVMHRVARSAVSYGRAGRNLIVDVRSGHLAVDLRAGGSNSDHRVLPQVFDGRVRSSDVLVDIGSGRGRVLHYMAKNFPDHDLFGIEIDPLLASRTSSRLATHARCTVIAGDAAVVLPPEATLLYMFNPFGRDVVESIRRHLEERPPAHLPIRILYVNPKHLDVFDGQPQWSCQRHALGGGRVLPHHDLAVIDHLDGRTPSGPLPADALPEDD